MPLNTDNVRKKISLKGGGGVVNRFNFFLKFTLFLKKKYIKSQKSIFASHMNFFRTTENEIILTNVHHERV